MLENITLSQDEIGVILGGLLGDSSLKRGKSSICFWQSTKQNEYLLWKYNILKNIAGKITIAKDNQGYEHICFYTRRNPELTKSLYLPLEKMIYENDRKTVNRKWLNMLTPLSLAVWWMDDGCLSIWKGNRYGKLCTHSFSLEEHEIMKQYFSVKWGIDVQITVEKKKYYFLRLNVENLKKLITIIYPFVIEIPSMIYKIDLNYKNIVNLGQFEEVYEVIKKHQSHAIK